MCMYTEGTVGNTGTADFVCNMSIAYMEGITGPRDTKYTVHTHIYIHIYLDMYVCVCIYMYIYIYIYTHVYSYEYICIYIYAYMCVHTLSTAEGSMCTKYSRCTRYAIYTRHIGDTIICKIYYVYPVYYAHYASTRTICTMCTLYSLYILYVLGAPHILYTLDIYILSAPYMPFIHYMPIYLTYLISPV